MGSSAKVTGRTSASPTVELRPGIAPANTPSRLPARSADRFPGWSAVRRPSRKEDTRRAARQNPEGSGTPKPTMNTR